MIALKTADLGINPKWSALDFIGMPLCGGKLYTYRNGTREAKATFSDPAASVPNTNPVILDAAGQATIYWETDEDYSIELFDQNGQLIYTRDNYRVGANANSGDGGSVLVAKPFQNVCRNAQFYDWRLGTTLELKDQLSALVMSEWFFEKSNQEAHDLIERGSFALGQSDVPFNPVYYVNCRCLDSGKGGETYKRLAQVFSGVGTFANTEMTFSFYAKASAKNLALEIGVQQQFGDGRNAAAPVEAWFSILVLSDVWERYRVTFTVPTVSGKSIDGQGDCLKLLIGLPTNTVYQSIALSNVQLQQGNTANDFFYVPPQQNNHIPLMQQFPTGWMQPIYTADIPAGWIPANDGTIGNTDSKATTRANYDTLALYRYLWTHCRNYCSVVGGYGSTAEQDFFTNKAIYLPKIQGRHLTASGYGVGLTARHPAQFGGSETHTLTPAQLPPHKHELMCEADSGYLNPCIKATFSTKLASRYTKDGSETGLKGEAYPIMSPWAAVPMMIKL